MALGGAPVARRLDVAGAVADFVAGGFGWVAGAFAVFAGDLALTERGAAVFAGGAGFAVFAAIFVFAGLAGGVVTVSCGATLFAWAGTRLVGDFTCTAGGGVAVFAGDVAVFLAGAFAVAVFAACVEAAGCVFRLDGAGCVVGDAAMVLAGGFAAFFVRDFGSPAKVAGLVAIVAVFAGVFVLRGGADLEGAAVTEGAAACMSRFCSPVGALVRLPILPELLTEVLSAGLASIWVGGVAAVCCRGDRLVRFEAGDVAGTIAGNGAGNVGVRLDGFG